jgi:hypothetical protein
MYSFYIGGAPMFKVVKLENANKTFRMPVELIKRLEEVAQNESVSVNNLVIQCCEYALNSRTTKDQDTKNQ